MNDIKQVNLKSRFVYISIAILLVFLVGPFLRQTGKSGHFFATLLVAMVPLTSFYALNADRKRAFIILFIAAPFVILDVINMFFTYRYLVVAEYSFATILYFYIVVLLIVNLLSYRVITANLVFCAISIYFMIGVMWAGVYRVLEGIFPGSFSGISETDDLLYFSFVTLTTVGFGEITPQSMLCKRLTVFESAMGSLYLAVVIAIIVGRYMSMQVKKNSESEIN